MSQPSASEPLDLATLRRFPLPCHPSDGDKEDRGLALFIAGSSELAGAALLAGTAALRAGAGKLRIATAERIALALGVAIPEARLIAFAEDEEGCIDRNAIETLVQRCAGADALTIGPGMQHGPPLRALIEQVLGLAPDTPLVLDAAALGVLPPLAAALRSHRGGAALLPHAGEMARLLEREREEVRRDPLAAVRDAAQLFGAVALVKGETSFIAAPDGRSFHFRGGGIGLATSGSGDALAGIVGGLAARGADPLTATLWGVWLHGEAGRRLSRQIGRIGYLARELLDLVPVLLEEAASEE